ncbi:hypothetical protein J3459_007631 [Metarhizium acridum]|nr:hypothetical protein J3459_007631 [Metarhizium acridum]
MAAFYSPAAASLHVRTRLPGQPICPRRANPASTKLDWPEGFVPSSTQHRRVSFVRPVAAAAVPSDFVLETPFTIAHCIWPCPSPAPWLKLPRSSLRGCLHACRAFSSFSPVDFRSSYSQCPNLSFISFIGAFFFLL